jgi:uncharacterized OB-fold protein
MVLPTPDRDSAPWWDAIAEHRLILQQCDSCGAWRWPPRILCNRCGALGGSWRPAAGTGRVASWTITHHQFDPAFTAPYVTVLVRLDEQTDILIPGAWAGDEAPTDGQRVTAGYDDVATGVSLLRWSP